MYSLFCSICKTHVEINAESKRAAIRKFHEQGHDETKQRRLRRGLVGWYRTAEQLQAEHDERARAKAAKQVEAAIAA